MSALASLSPREQSVSGGPPSESDVVTASRVIPASDASYGEFPDLIDERLLAVLSAGASTVRILIRPKPSPTRSGDVMSSS